MSRRSASASEFAYALAKPKPRVFVFPDIRENAWTVQLDPVRNGRLIGVSQRLYEKLDRLVMEARGESISNFVDLTYVSGRSVTLAFPPAAQAALGAEIPADIFDAPQYQQVVIAPEWVDVTA